MLLHDPFLTFATVELHFVVHRSCLWFSRAIGGVMLMRSSKSFADVVLTNKGHTTGFDYLRIVLSAAVVVAHCFLLGAGQLDLVHTPFRPLHNAILPAFFALSGYLVASSMLRNSIPQFIALRVLRIFPALVVEVVLSAVVLGAAFTVLPLRDYFTHPEFGEYLLNMFGIIHYTLPGVFEGGLINLQLWTIPLELECYILMVALGLFGLISRRHLTLALGIVGCLLLTVLSLRTGAANNLNVSGRVLVMGFLFGCLIYLYRDRLPYSLPLFVVSLVLTGVTLSIPGLSYFCAGPVAYATIYVGLQKWKPIPFGDYSYGLYLFHFPVAQTINHMNGAPLPWYLLLVSTLVVTTLFAAASWNFIEAPLIARKPQVLAWVQRKTTRRLQTQAT